METANFPNNVLTYKRKESRKRGCSYWLTEYRTSPTSYKCTITMF